MHYTHESPHKDRIRSVCVTVVVISFIFTATVLFFLTNGPMRKAQFVLITFCGATKHQLTFVHTLYRHTFLQKNAGQLFSALLETKMKR